MKYVPVVAALLTAVVLLTASSAAAGPPHLSIQSAGKALEVGATVNAELELEEGKFTFGLCQLEESGSLERNNRPSDLMSFPSSTSAASCLGESLTGRISRLVSNWAGETRWIQEEKNKLHVTVGKCVYEFQRISTHTSFPGSLDSQATLQGYLVRNESNISCSALEPFIFYAKYGGLEGELLG